jgi:hypothetical protein
MKAMDKKHAFAQWFFAVLLLIVLLICLAVSGFISMKAIESRMAATAFRNATPPLVLT